MTSLSQRTVKDLLTIPFSLYQLIVVRVIFVRVRNVQDFADDHKNIYLVFSSLNNIKKRKSS